MFFMFIEVVCGRRFVRSAEPRQHQTETIMYALMFKDGYGLDYLLAITATEAEAEEKAQEFISYLPKNMV